MELIASFTIADLVVLVTLALGVFVGFQQGLFRSLLNCVVVLVSFMLASQLKGPIAETLNGIWRMGTPEQQELWIYLTLLVIGYVGGYLLVRTFYRQTRIPIVRQVDEVLGAIVGVLFVALLYCFTLVTLDTFFQTLSEQAASVATILGPIYDFLNSSIILTWMQDWVTPIAGFIVRPFVPDDIEQFLVF